MKKYINEKSEMGIYSLVYTMDDVGFQVTQRMFKNEPLVELNEKKCLEAMTYMAIINNELPQNLINKIKAMRSALPNFLAQYDDCLKKLSQTYEDYYNFQQLEREKLEHLPKQANEDDTEETVNFIMSLEKEYYNYSEAECLLKICRQTIKRWATKGVNGIKYENRIGLKREYLSKDSIIQIYRHKYADVQSNFKFEAA